MNLSFPRFGAYPYIVASTTFAQQYECYDEFFELEEFAFTEDGASTFQDTCLDCDAEDYTHYTILFNAFVFCQIFNEFNARSIFDQWNVFKGLSKNPLFFAIIIITTILQVRIATSLSLDFLSWKRVPRTPQ